MTGLTSPAAVPQVLLEALRSLIQQGRGQALRAVDMVQVQTCWQMGRHIVEFEQGGESRASYGKKLLPRLAQVLTREFGKGFDDRNLRNMRAFYLAFPIWNAVRTELSWTHYRLMLRVSEAKARDWYMNEAATQNWSSRALDRQINTLYFERLLLSSDKASVTAEANTNIAALAQTPREFVRDPVLHDSEQIYASKYRLVLPTEDELRAEITRERQALDEARRLDEECHDSYSFNS